MKFLRRRLKNGMTVLMEWRELPVVALGISNRFGAAFEESKIKGIAHVIEHLLFTGTKTRTHEDISREIEKKGGVVNAFTANEITSYYFKLPSEHVFAGLDTRELELAVRQQQAALQQELARLGIEEVKDST